MEDTIIDNVNSFSSNNNGNEFNEYDNNQMNQQREQAAANDGNGSKSHTGLWVGAGVGTGAAATVGAAAAMGVFNGDKSVDEGFLTAEQDAQDAEQLVAENHVEEPKPAQHVHIHHHHHDEQTPPSDADPIVMSYNTVSDGEGGYMDVAAVSIDGHSAIVVDVDRDGTADVLMQDSNGNGQFDTNEVLDVTASNIDMGELRDNALVIGDESINHDETQPLTEVEVLDWQSEDGIDMAQVRVNGQEAVLADVDQDGSADYMFVDLNENQMVDDGEIVDVSDSEIDMNALHNQYVANGGETEPSNVTVDEPAVGASHTAASELGDNGITVTAYGTVDNGDGGQMDVAVLDVDGQEVALADVDQNGMADYMLVDVNENGNIENDEIFDVSDSNIEMEPLQQAAMYESEMADSGVESDDYVNDANVDDFMA